MIYEYSGTLQEGSPTYVKRKADDELYAELEAGQFCYVFNASKAGKSSLQVQVQSSLKKEGFACSNIDIQGIGTNLSLEQWYITILSKIAKDLNLKDDLSNWKKENKENNELSPLYRFKDFIESVMLTKISKNIVIFIDEINHIHKLKFSTDEFFGFIRFCYNERAYNSSYKRLRFCLLGIASPSNLVKDKQITPFNIIKSISLEPFVLEDVEPLQRGLGEKFDDTEAMMKEILYWTGGQPFLTQKLCKLMVDNSEKDHPCSVEEVVRKEIIEKWQSHDSPAHLKTIRDRIVESPKASYLIELYKKILVLEEVDSNDITEASDLLLSGIVVKIDEKLKVYNRIYQEIFNQKWIEIQLNNLRPYSENYYAWLASEKQDKSRLLRGEALQEAEEWKIGKGLSYDEKEYLDSSQEQERQEEITAKKQKVDLEIEKDKRQAAEKRKQLIVVGSVAGFSVFFIALLSSFFTVRLTEKRLAKAKQQIGQISQPINAVQEITDQAERLQVKDNYAYNEALRLSALSFSIKNSQLKRALLLVTKSQVKQGLQELKKAQENIKIAEEVLSKLAKLDKKVLDSSEGLQVQILFHLSKGSLLDQEKQTQLAIESYKTAFSLWKSHPGESYSNISNKLVTPENVEFIHLALLKLISQNSMKKDLKKQVKESLKDYLYTQLEYYLKNQSWLVADETTFKLILIIAKKDEDNSLDRNVPLDSDSVNKLSCLDLEKIDNLWVKYSQGRFGYSVQGKILRETGNKLAQYNESTYTRFGKQVGWYDEKRDKQSNGGGWLNRRHQELNYSIKAPIGHLPGNAGFWLWSGTSGLYEGWQFSNRTAACTLPVSLDVATRNHNRSDPKSSHF